MSYVTVSLIAPSLCARVTCGILRAMPHRLPPADRYEIYAASPDRWSWQLVSASNVILAESPVSYPTIADCLRAIDAMRAIAHAPVKGYPEWPVG